MINVQDCLKDFRCKIGVSDEAPIHTAYKKAEHPCPF